MFLFILNASIIYLLFVIGKSIKSYMSNTILNLSVVELQLLWFSLSYIVTYLFI